MKLRRKTRIEVLRDSSEHWTAIEEFYRPLAEELGSDWYVLPDELSNSMLREVLLWHGGELVGFCHLLIPSDDCAYLELYDMVVKREYRRRGYGTAMMKRAVSYARRMGYRGVWIVENEAPAFYSSLPWYRRESRSDEEFELLSPAI